ncbi:PaaI family thioesterase [Sphingobium estronivorans]|uniref:PaaI family thioesterase n=1 Tax=Sphingobium estronivorans TaxID=1577690 RepID=UPI00123AFB2C|nr:PaaI family thioesterase [Sphingobium estronivorans]
MIAETPYAQMLGICSLDAGVLMMPVSPDLEGRPGFLYGGVIASLLELACLEAVALELGGVDRRPRPVNISFDFLRGGEMADSFAQAQIVRIGKRIVNATALCWQGDRDKPIATARMHLMLD